MMENMGKNLQQMMDRNQLNETYQKLIEGVLKDPDVVRFIHQHQEQLTQEMIERSYAKLYEYVVEKKKFENQEDTLAPGHEPQLMIGHQQINVIYTPTPEYRAKQKVTEIKNRVRSMDIPKDIREASFEKLELTAERQEAIQKAYEFVEKFLEKPKAFHQGLYLQGPFGVGKTYLLGAIAYELAENGYPSTIMHFPSFAVEMKQSIGQNTTGEKLESIKRAPILMLDDIGADSMSSWIRDDVLGVILQYRMQEQLPTFFSSNFSMDQLENEHLRMTQRGEDEPLKAKRIMERIRYLAEEVVVSGENRRHQ